MVVGTYVTKLHLIVADLGNACFDGQHGLHFFLGRCLVAARHDEQLLQIILVGSKHALVLRVVRQVVIAGAQTQSALPQTDNIPVGIAQVGIYPYAEHHRALAVAVELGCHKLILFLVLNVGNALERGLDGCPSLAVQTHAVHHQIVERTYLLLQRALLLPASGILQNDVLNALLAQFIQVGKGPVVRVFAVEGMAFQPSARGKMVEIVARPNAAVEVLQVNARRKVLAEHAGCGEHQAQKK